MFEQANRQFQKILKLKLIIKIKCLSVFLRISSEIPERRSKTFFLSQFNTCIIHIIKERKYILITE